MNPFKSIKRRIRRLTRSNDDPYDDRTYDDRPVTYRSWGRVISNVVLFPIRAIFFPFKALGLFRDIGIDVDDYGMKPGFKKRLRRFGRTLVQLPVRLSQAPVKLFQKIRTAARKDILYVLPGLVAIGLFAFVFLQVFVFGHVIDRRYQKGAADAMTNADYELAKTYLQRIMARKKLDSPQQFQWALILAQTGETERAGALFKELAPEDAIGYGPAHKLLAISISQQLGEIEDPEVLKKLRWHLQNSPDTSPEIQQAWAVYYMAVEQYDDAIAVLDKTAEVNPQSYMTISAIYKGQRRNAESERALEKAVEAFQKQLDRDELDHESRVSLANALARLQEYDRAEDQLKRGLRIRPDPFIKSAMADFYVMRHDLAREENQDVAVQMKYLVDAIDLDPEHSPVYSRMMTMFMDANKSKEAVEEIRATFQQIVAGDNPTPLAHLALSNVLWQEGNKKDAQFHLEQAYSMDNKIVVALNNLAWMLAHANPPDLERALELSQTAVKQAPDDKQYCDTLGTIYLKMGRDRDAVTELEKSLSGVTDKPEVHRKLAIAYGNLGMEDLAKIHKQKSVRSK